MRRFYFSCLALFAVSLLCTGASAANLLLNGGFESPDASGGDVPGAPGAPWAGFNDPGNRFTTQTVARSGLQSLKMFGPFDFIGGGIGGTQKVAAATGDTFVAEIYARNDSSDPIQGNNFGVYKIEYLDAGMNLVSGGILGVDVFESNPINASTPQDEWTLLGVGTAPAPVGTAFAQAVIVQVQLGDGQDNFVGGSIFWDDASLENRQIPEPSGLALTGLASVAGVLGYRLWKR